jgi:plasmid stabilization system protein ParE
MPEQADRLSARFDLLVDFAEIDRERDEFIAAIRRHPSAAYPVIYRAGRGARSSACCVPTRA